MEIYMYNIYIAHAYIHYVYILCNIHKSEVIAGEKRPDQSFFFLGEGNTTFDETRVCREERKRKKIRKKNSSAIDLCIPRDTLLRRKKTCNKE